MKCNMERMQLHQCLPLPAPLSVHIFPSFFCNFKCQYCLHNLSSESLEAKGFQKQFMDFAVYQKAIQDMSARGWHLKALIFAGHGEPLLHPDISAMVALAKEKRIADRIEIVTNASMLTHKLSDALIAAGLDRLRISLQGVTAQQYQTISGVELDFDAFWEQIRYFYQHKTDTEVYIKIIDLALQGAEERFEALCREASDVHAIEYAIPFVPEIDLGQLSGNCKQGNRQHSNVCSMPFYMMILYPNGDVVPCCATQPPAVLGNIKTDDFTELWHSSQQIRFLLRQLEGAGGIPVCDSCAVPAFGLQEGDYLDGGESELKLAYKTLLEKEEAQ